MALIGNVHPDIMKLSRVTREAMFAAIQVCKPGAQLSEIGAVIE